MKEGGEIYCCDIQFKIKRANKKRMGQLLKIIETLSPPKGSMLGYKKNQIPIGEKEGLSLYLNGHELEEDVYKNCSIDVVIEKLNESMKDRGGCIAILMGKLARHCIFTKHLLLKWKLRFNHLLVNTHYARSALPKNSLKIKLKFSLHT